MNKYTVGQQLWWEWDDHRRGSNGFVTVVKVGRKWLELSNRFRVDIETLRADGRRYSSPGACYVDRESRLLERATEKAWISFVSDAWRTRAPKPGITLSDIEKARALLGIPA